MNDERCDTCGAPATMMVRDTILSPTGYYVEFGPIGNPRYGCDAHPVEGTHYVSCSFAHDEQAYRYSSEDGTWETLNDNLEEACRRIREMFDELARGYEETPLGPGVSLCGPNDLSYQHAKSVVGVRLPIRALSAGNRD